MQHGLRGALPIGIWTSLLVLKTCHRLRIMLKTVRLDKRSFRLSCRLIRVLVRDGWIVERLRLSRVIKFRGYL